MKSATKRVRNSCLGARFILLVALTAPGLLAQQGTKLLWSLPFPSDRFLASPAIAKDGTIYIAGISPEDSGSHAGERRLWAITPDGRLKWPEPAYLGAKLSTNPPPNHPLDYDKGGEGSPAIGPDGTIYIGSWNYTFWAVNPDGTIKWRYTPTDAPKGVLRTTPVIGPDGKIYCFFDKDPLDKTAAATAFLAKFQDNGTNATRLWTWHDPPNPLDAWNPNNVIHGDAIASPALGRDGAVYLATHDLRVSGTKVNYRFGWIHAIDATSDSVAVKKWTYPGSNEIMGPVVASPIIDADGRLLIGSERHFFLDSGMSPEFSGFDVMTGDLSSSPHRILGYTTAQNPTTGETDPYRANGGAVDGTPAIGANGLILIPVDTPGTGAGYSRVQALDQRSGAQVWKFDLSASGTQHIASSIVVTADGSIFFKRADLTTDDATFLHVDVAGNLVQTDGHDEIFAIGKEPMDWHNDWDHIPAGISAVFSSPAMSDDGRVYCATLGYGTPENPALLNCFTTAIAAPGFWSNFRANSFNTGNLLDNAATTSSTGNTNASMAGVYSIAGATNAFGFSQTSTAGAQYIILGTTNLADWIPLKTNTAPFIFADTGATNSSRFYRTQLKP